MARERSYRKRRAEAEAEADADEDADIDDSSVRNLADTRAQQRQRHRQPGISSDSLLEGAPQHTDLLARVPALRKGNEESEELLASYVKEEKKDTGSADPEMEKFIEEQMQKRLGRQRQAEDAEPETQAERDERELYAIPDDLQGQKAVLHDSSAYMTGILEVPLGVNFKMRNIEETEAAKRRLLSGSGEGLGGLEDDEDLPQQPRGLHRAVYPRNFGRTSAQDIETRAAHIRDWEGRSPSRGKHKRR